MLSLLYVILLFTISPPAPFFFQFWFISFETLFCFKTWLKDGIEKMFKWGNVDRWFLDYEVIFVYIFFRREQFVQFVDGMEGPQTPSWLGLPNNAEKVLLTTLGSDMIAKLMRMQVCQLTHALTSLLWLYQWYHIYLVIVSLVMIIWNSMETHPQVTSFMYCSLSAMDMEVQT